MKFWWKLYVVHCTFAHFSGNSHILLGWPIYILSWFLHALFVWKKCNQKVGLWEGKWKVWDMGFPQIVGSKKLLPSPVSIPIWTFVSSPSFSQLVTEFARCPYLAWEEEPPGISQKARIIILVVICGHWVCYKRFDMSFQNGGIMGLWCGHLQEHSPCLSFARDSDRTHHFRWGIPTGDDSFMIMKQTQRSEWYLEKEVGLPSCILKPTNTAFCFALEWPR